MGLIFLSSSVLNLHLESSRACVTGDIVQHLHRRVAAFFLKLEGQKSKDERHPRHLTDLDCRCEEVFSC